MKLSFFSFIFSLLIIGGVSCVRSQGPDDSAKHSSTKGRGAQKDGAVGFVDPPRHPPGSVLSEWPTRHLGFSRVEYNRTLARLFSTVDVSDLEFSDVPFVSNIRATDFTQAVQDEFGESVLRRAIANRSVTKLEGASERWNRRVRIARIERRERELPFRGVRVGREILKPGLPLAYEYTAFEEATHIWFEFGEYPEIELPSQEEIRKLSDGPNSELALLQQRVKLGRMIRKSFRTFVLTSKSPRRGRSSWDLTSRETLRSLDLTGEAFWWEFFLRLPASTPTERLCVAMLAAGWFSKGYLWWESDTGLAFPSFVPPSLTPWAFSYFARHESITDQQRLYAFWFRFLDHIPDGNLEEFEDCLLPRQLIEKRKAYSSMEGYRGPLRISTLHKVRWEDHKESIIKEARLLSKSSD